MGDKNQDNVNSAFQRLDRKIGVASDNIGNLLVNGFHHLALFAIGAATVWASVFAFLHMVEKGTSTVEDLLLLFIYLEVGAMVGIYFKTNRMPVRFLIYVAITALTRLLISIANHHEIAIAEHKMELDGQFIVMISLSILLLAGAALILRYGSNKFPLDAILTKVEDDN